MNKLIASLLSLTLSAALLAGCSSTPAPTSTAPAAGTTGAPAKVLQVGLTQIVEHPSLDEIRSGVIAGLKEAGFEDGTQIKIDFQSAQGEMPIAQQIAQKFVGDKKDIIIALTTPSAQAAVQAAKEIPVIFGSVTDPVGAQLVTALDKPGANVTGTSDMTPVKEQLELFGQLGLKANRIGMIYNSGEANSVFMVGEAKKAAGALGLTIVEANVSNANEVQQAAQSLIGRVDGLYLITDNTLAQGVASVIALAKEKKLPALSAVNSYVEQGALASSSFDYYQIGRQTGLMAARVLKGEKPANIPVLVSKDIKLVINTKTVEALGINIPADMLNKADKVAK